MHTIHEISGTALILPLVKTVSAVIAVTEGYKGKILGYEFEVEYFKMHHFIDENGAEEWKNESSIFKFQSKEKAEEERTILLINLDNFYASGTQ